MNSKERLLATLRGEKTDKTAWAPFLSYWWEGYAGTEKDFITEIDFKRSTGCDILQRGHFNRASRDDYKELKLFECIYQTSTITEYLNEQNKKTVYSTPVGDLEAGYVYSEAANTWFLTDHPVKSENDLKILQYLVRDCEILPNYDDYIKATSENPDTLFIPLVSQFDKSALQSMIEVWIGLEEMVYALADYPEEVHKTLEIMREASLKAAVVSADSPAEVFISWEDTSTTNVSPTWYKDYVLPEINAWCDVLHEKNKMYVQHACGYIRGLVPLIADSKIDAIESVASAPTGDIDAWELKDRLPENIGIIGGIEPTFLMGSDDNRIIEHVEFLLDQFKDNRFIMANADSCPPSVDINRFGMISKKVASVSGMDEIVIKKF